MEASIVYLLYHELQLAGRSLCQSEPGYVRYVIPETEFRAQMHSLQSMGRRGISVSEALRNPTPSSIAITFDDGCETDLLSAAPILKEINFGATFYITVGFLGRSGYMSPLQVRGLADFAFEIGCHSMSHPYLTDLDDDDVRQELGAPKETLEQLIGRPVKHFSCPGGRWNFRVAELAREAGYQSVATSRNSANSAKTHAYSLGRVAIKRKMDLSAFNRISCAQGLWRLQLTDVAASAVKRVMGNTGYDAIRGLLLHK
jgi:peptidoglycan/xylan/chitin deacetylase (PgdA/CDA1 family)